MNLDNPVFPAVFLNVFIISIIAGLVLFLKEPLGILALFLLVPIPQLEFREYDEREGTDAIGNELAGEYDGDGMGFISKSKK